VLLLRSSFLLFLFFSFLFAKVKIFATKAIDKNETIILNNPIIFYKDKIIQAKKGLVNKDKTIILEDEVYINDTISTILADKLIAKTSKQITINDLFFYDKKMDGWVLSKKAKSIDNKLFFKNLYFSTCCIEDPNWYMKANKGVYNKKTKSLDLYNFIVVINKIPIIYLPYLNVNFDKTRRSGLLKPYIGLSQREGILYSQPVYFVTSINSDLELIPTIRTLRGAGIYSTFRFIDSATSKGSIKVGYFKDKKEYLKQNNLLNQEHYGINIRYEKDKIFSLNDSLYMNLKYANDLNYFYLDAFNYTFDNTYLTDKIITSKLNYIHLTNSSLYGIYNQYFINTSKTDNDSTWQILPQLNFHYFVNKKYGVLNSIDFNIYNYHRKKGSNFLFSDFYMPLSLYFSFFNDYLKLKISEILNYGYGFYYQEENKKSKYINLSTQIRLYSSLIKNSLFLHYLSPSFILNVKNYSKSEIYSDLIDVSEVQNYLTFELFQILKKNNFKLTHTLKNTYYIDNDEFSELENNILINLYKFVIEENNKYSLKNNYFTYNFFKIGYNNSKFDFSIANIYKRDISNSINLDIGYSLSIYKKIYMKHSFDLNSKYIKYWLMGFKFDNRCFYYNFSFKQSRIPLLKESGISYIKDNIFFFDLELKPVGGIKQAFVFKGNK